jgi:hypothetical protein
MVPKVDREDKVTCANGSSVQRFANIQQRSTMKSKPVFRILTTGLLLATPFAAAAVQVTFQADMSYQTLLGSFNPATDVVEARGAFQSPTAWTGGFTLTNSPANTNLYTGTYDVTAAAGSVLLYKFVALNVVGGVTNANWETLQNNASSVNRQFTLGSSAQTLPAAYFADIWGGLPIPVTFQVDMSVQSAVGRFNADAGDFVEARGSFGGTSWPGGFMLTNSPANTNLFTGTYDVPLPPGATVYYKFVNNSTTLGTQWENDPNRFFALDASGQTLPVVFFNNVSGFPTKAAIYFQVNMDVQKTTGAFDPAIDQVWARGNILGWNAPPNGLQLLEDTTRPGIYTNLWSATNFITGDQFQYKLTIWHPAISGTVWEDGGNKLIVFTGSEPTNPDGYHLITVAPAYFNNLSPSDVLAQDTLVTFRLNMTNAVTFGAPGTPFDPATQGVYLNGNFVPWWVWSGLPSAYEMKDDGSTYGDALAGDLIYSWQQTFTKGSSARVEYKYGIQSNDNEAGFGQNHVRYINSYNATYVMPIDTFGVQYQEPAVGAVSISSQPPGSVTLTWNGRPGIHVQQTSSLSPPAWQDVASSDGVSSIVLGIGSGNKYYRLVKP